VTRGRAPRPGGGRGLVRGPSAKLCRIPIASDLFSDRRHWAQRFGPAGITRSRDALPCMALRRPGQYVNALAFVAVRLTHVPAFAACGLPCGGSKIAPAIFVEAR